MGTETNDYEKIAKEEHLKPIEINLRMMEDIVKSIHEEVKYLFKNVIVCIF
jgi:p24 family protein delta-1